MSKEALDVINERLLSYFTETGIKDACFYLPQDPTEYWEKTHKKIAFCNIEPYSTHENNDTIRGFKPLDGELFFEHWFFNRTVGMTVFINFLLTCTLHDKIQMTENLAKEIKKELKNDKHGYDKLCENFSKSLYFNFRYTQSENIFSDNNYIYSKYINEEFYRKHYREFIKAAEIDALVIAGSTGARLIHVIYPELAEKFKYCGSPVFHEGTFFISMPHPSRISWKARVEVVNKISKVLN